MKMASEHTCCERRLVAALCLLVGLSASFAGARGAPRYMDENYQIPAVDPVLAQKNLNECMRFGLPSGDNLRLFNSFIVSYDRRLKEPVWVFEHLTGRNFQGSANRQGMFFKEDLTLHDYFRADNYDYMRSGYSRGHQASAGDYLMSANSMAQTFTLSNIVPQNSVMNSGGWVRLEHYVRFLAKHPEVANVYAVTGPAFLPFEGQDHKLHVVYQVIGSHQVAVPSHLFKVFLIERKSGRLSLEAFLMPNTNEAHADIQTINKYRVPIEKLDFIERSTGFVFFPNLNRKNADQPTDLQLNYVDQKVTFS